MWIIVDSDNDTLIYLQLSIISFMSAFREEPAAPSLGGSGGYPEWYRIRALAEGPGGKFPASRSARHQWSSDNETK